MRLIWTIVTLSFVAGLLATCLGIVAFCVRDNHYSTLNLNQSSIICTNLSDGTLYIGFLRADSPSVFDSVDQHDFRSARQWEAIWIGKHVNVGQLGMRTYSGLPAPCGPGLSTNYDFRLDRIADKSIKGVSAKAGDFFLSITRSGSVEGFPNTSNWNLQSLEGTRLQFSSPWWLSIAIGIFLTVPFWAHRAKSRIVKSRIKLRACVKCAYDLQGNTSGICPECGTRIEPIKTAP